jgi:uncharacterized cupin superfamily protein
MQTIDVNDLNIDEQMNRQSISEPVGAEDFSMNYYVLEPGEEFTSSLHAHLDQEESFFILEGQATFETKPEPTAESDTVSVSEGQMIRFDPGEYQQGKNESNDTLRALALGTPKESTDVRVAMPCQECGESEYLEFVMIDGEPAVECPECSAEFPA